MIIKNINEVTIENTSEVFNSNTCYNNIIEDNCNGDINEAYCIELVKKLFKENNIAMDVLEIEITGDTLSAGSNVYVVLNRLVRNAKFTMQIVQGENIVNVYIVARRKLMVGCVIK